MSDKIKDGGPAFPCPANPDEGHTSPVTGEWVDTSEFATASTGMTLRDWFAGQALAHRFTTADGADTESAVDVARWAYIIADAMLAAREAK